MSDAQVAGSNTSRGRRCAALAVVDVDIPSTLRGQEEALCYTSTLYATLREVWYPWPNLGPGSAAGIFSPGVVVFKDDLDHGCIDLPVLERRVVSVMTVAAPRTPKLTSDGTRLAREEDLEDFKAKMRLVYRMAGVNGKTALILGARAYLSYSQWLHQIYTHTLAGPMGCGVYGCPPEQVAEEMKAVLLEDEFRGWFGAVVFAVYRPANRASRNFDVFKQILEGVVV
jgi:hypothetical protein